jgi:hypothetical protein
VIAVPGIVDHPDVMTEREDGPHGEH